MLTECPKCERWMIIISKPKIIYSSENNVKEKFKDLEDCTYIDYDGKIVADRLKGVCAYMNCTQKFWYYPKTKRITKRNK